MSMTEKHNNVKCIIVLAAISGDSQDGRSGVTVNEYSSEKTGFRKRFTPTCLQSVRIVQEADFKDINQKNLNDQRNF